MGFLSKVFGGKSKSKSKSEVTPWGPARPGLVQSALAMERWGQTPMRFFPEQTYADYTPDEMAALDMLRGAAGAYPGMLQGMMQPGMQALTGALGAPQAALDMGLTNVYENPAVTGMADAIQARLNRNLAENVLPGIRASAATRGTLGGSGQEIREAVAGRGTQEALSSALADLYGGAYQSGLTAETARYGAGLGAQQAAIGALPGMANLALSGLTEPASILESVGVKERAQDQRAIDEAMARYEFEQMEPYQRASMVASGLMPMASGFATTRSESETKERMSPFQAMGNLGYLASGMFGGMGGMGGLAGMFSRPAMASSYAQRIPMAGNRAMQMGWF